MLGLFQGSVEEFRESVESFVSTRPNVSLMQSLRVGSWLSHLQPTKGLDRLPRTYVDRDLHRQEDRSHLTTSDKRFQFGTRIHGIEEEKPYCNGSDRLLPDLTS